MIYLLAIGCFWLAGSIAHDASPRTKECLDMIAPPILLVAGLVFAGLAFFSSRP